jgi:archaellum component FlaC
MKKQSTAQKVPAPEPARTVNAKFQSRLKGMLEEISQAVLTLDPVIADVTVPLREFVDYLDFEIGKTQLDISRQKWESVVDVQKVASNEAWLKRLVDLRNEFDVEKMTESVRMLRSMVEKVQQTFEIEGGD